MHADYYNKLACRFTRLAEQLDRAIERAEESKADAAEWRGKYERLNEQFQKILHKYKTVKGQLGREGE